MSNLRNWLLKAETILVDINRKKLQNDSMRLWVKELQDIVYEVDDLLNRLVYEDLQTTAEQTENLRKVRDFISIPPSKNPFLFRC